MICIPQGPGDTGYFDSAQTRWPVAQKVDLSPGIDQTMPVEYHPSLEHWCTNTKSNCFKTVQSVKQSPYQDEGAESEKRMNRLVRQMAQSQIHGPVPMFQLGNVPDNDKCTEYRGGTI